MTLAPNFANVVIYVTVKISLSMNFLFFLALRILFYFSYMTKLCLKILLVHRIGTGKRGQCYKKLKL